MLQPELSIFASITSLVSGSITTEEDGKAWEDDKDILKHEDCKDISNVAKEKAKGELTRESEEDTEEESFIEVIMSGKWQWGILMLLTCSVNYIFTHRCFEPYRWEASLWWALKMRETLVRALQTPQTPNNTLKN